MRIVIWALAVVFGWSVPASAGPILAKEQEMRRCANGLRVDNGLVPLRSSAALGKAARLQSRSMARRGYFDHDDPDGQTPTDRVRLFTDHFSGVGENIAAGYPTAHSACRGWFRSLGHRRNILDPDYTAIGTGFAVGGRYGRYYTQVFGIDAEPGDESLALGWSIWWPLG